jgi:hypothetical protein
LVFKSRIGIGKGDDIGGEEVPGIVMQHQLRRQYPRRSPYVIDDLVYRKALLVMSAGVFKLSSFHLGVEVIALLDRPRF